MVSSAAILVHGGAGCPPEWNDGCRKAAAQGRRLLQKGGSAVDAVVAAVQVLEADGRFNAGRGSVLRLDGKTLEMDAAVMAGDGSIGAVASIQDVESPVAVARDVMEIPHILLVGAGATAFARRRGHRRFVTEPTKEVRDRFQKLVEALAGKGSFHRRLDPAWEQLDLEEVWNFSASQLEAFRCGCDTVGAVARDAEGRFAVAGSTGGASPMLRGRVGDTPLVGSGFYAGPAGAVAATGVGEEIASRVVSFRLYELLESGIAPSRACRRIVDGHPAEHSVGVIAISAAGMGSACNRPMARARASL